jgi:uncharacterized membrane protein YhaH (DUF805 family)
MASYSEFLFARDGRICRKDFWLKYALPFAALSFGASMADAMLGTSGAPDSSGPISNVLNLVLVWPRIVITAKRFHDRDMSGWWQIAFNVAVLGGALLIFVSVGNGGSLPLMVTGGLIALTAGLVELVILGFLPGTQGLNKYGEDPLNPTGSLADTFA